MMADSDGLDYLMPTCMQRKLTSCDNLRYGVTKHTGPRVLDLYNDSLEALETDTCSEASDMSYAEATYFTKMKLSARPYYTERFCSKPLYDQEELGSQFSRSLKQFLEWPDPTVSAENEIDAAIQRFECREGLKNRRRLVERKKKGGKLKNYLPRKPAFVCKYVDSDSDYIPESDSYESDGLITGITLPNTFTTAAHQNTEILKHNLMKPRESFDETKTRSLDSDSDYRTLSDTSSEKIDHTFAQFGEIFVDITPLKELLVSVTNQAESFVTKLSRSKVLKPLLKKDGAKQKAQKV